MRYCTNVYTVKFLINELSKELNKKADKSVVDALQNGIIKQDGVDTYNSTSGGKTSLASVYGLTDSDNGTSL